MGNITTLQNLNTGWTLTALNPEAAPAELREALAAGIPATVPGEAALDLLNAGLIDEPFDGDNETRQQWIGDIDWRFTCTFDWHDDGATRHDLVAGGLDTVADLRLNGRPVGHTENCHRSYRWDVRDLLHEGGNTLEVVFASPVRESDRREQELGYLPHTEHHAFNQLRKPSYSFGWDWGIDVANAGIWRPIGIESWSGVRFAAVRPLVDVDRRGNGVLTVEVEIEREGAGRVMSAGDSHRQTAVAVAVAVRGHGADVTGSVVVKPGTTRAAVILDVDDVERWWPLGYGEQPLYDVDVTASVTAGTDGVPVDRPSDAAPQAAWSGRVGFRTVRVDTAADDEGRPFQIYVNDVPVHARGYNWIPDDAYISRVSHADYERGVRDLVESNSNMVRVWGGGIYESDDLYDLCDERGVMVWQDFMLACAAYGEDAFTKAEIEAEAREHINRLACHPSLVVWNGSNENYVAHAEWGGNKQAVRADDLPAGEYGYGQKPWGEAYYREVFPALLAELDPTRVYIESSPMSFTPYTAANLDTDGTMHIWDVWNRVDYRKYAEYRPRFADEFGYQAPPAWSTLTGAVHDELLDPFGTQMLVHQKASGGNIKLARGMRGHLTPGHINDVSANADGTRNWLIPTDTWADIEDWHWACQLQQAQAIRFGVEYMRSIEPVNAGALIWQLNDDWPVVSWAAVDFNGHRKPLWYASRDFFTPRLATIQPRISAQAREDHNWEGVDVATYDHLALAVLNDTREAVATTWTVRRMTLGGETLAEGSFEVALGPVDHRDVPLPADLAAFGDPANEILVATPADPSLGFARTVYNPAEVIDQNLSADPVTVAVEATGDGYDLTVSAKAYARDVFCMVDKVDPQARIDGGLVTLLPGESVTWHVACGAVADPSAFAAAKVMRSANDLKR